MKLQSVLVIPNKGTESSQVCAGSRRDTVTEAVLGASPVSSLTAYILHMLVDFTHLGGHVTFSGLRLVNC